MIKINCNEKLLLYLFLITAGLISTVQVSAQKEIAPGVIKLQKGEIDTFTPIPCLVASLS